MLTSKMCVCGGGDWWSFLYLDTRRTMVSDSDRLLLVLPSTKILVISKPPPTSHNGPVFTFTLRLRHITKITVCSPYMNKRFYKKALDSEGWGVTQKQAEKDRAFFLPARDDRFALGGHCDKGRAEWKNDSPQSSPVIFCLHTAHTPIISAPPLNR